MAANVPTPRNTKEGPLSGFERISKLVYLYRPAVGGYTAGGGTSASPKLILIGGWMEAREPHLAKYTTQMQALFPDSPILLVKSFSYHFTWKTSLHPKEIEPALPIIKSLLLTADPSSSVQGGDPDPDPNHDHDRRRPEILVHVFSNGGSATLRYLYSLMQRDASLPPHVTIFDSAPGRFQWTNSVRVFTMGFAKANPVVRAILTSVVSLLFGVYWLLHVPWGRPGYLDRIWAVHNDQAQNHAEVRRTYIYSEADRVIDYKDIEEHAAVARTRGYDVRLEKFQGTEHVSHIRGDENRYWNIVKESWGGFLGQ